MRKKRYNQFQKENVGVKRMKTSRKQMEYFKTYQDKKKKKNLVIVDRKSLVRIVSKYPSPFQ